MFYDITQFDIMSDCSQRKTTEWLKTESVRKNKSQERIYTASLERGESSHNKQSRERPIVKLEPRYTSPKTHNEPSLDSKKDRKMSANNNGRLASKALNSNLADVVEKNEETSPMYLAVNSKPYKINNAKNKVQALIKS